MTSLGDNHRATGCNPANQTKGMMMRKLTERDHIFDGFATRNFEPSIDGWRNEIPDANDYPSVRNAMDTIAMFEELRAAKRRIWELEEEVKMWKPVAMQAVTG
jgi:hypothetical protein